MSIQKHVFAAFLTALAPFALAQSPGEFKGPSEKEGGGLYIVPQVGHMKLAEDCLGNRRTCSGSEVVAGLAGGLRVNSYAAAEVGYRSASGWSAVVGTASQGQSSVDVVRQLDYTSFSYGARLDYPLSFQSRIGLMGRIGLHQWDLSSDRSSHDGNDMYYGGGFWFQVAPNINAIAEYTRYDLNGGRADYASASIAYHL